MKAYQPTVLNTLRPYCGPQGFGMSRYTGQTIDQQTTVASNQIDPTPFRGYSVPTPALAYFGLSENKRSAAQKILMITSPLYGIMKLLAEDKENDRYQIVYRQMVTDIRNEWNSTGKVGDVFTTKDPASDLFMDNATLGRVNFWVPKLTTGDKGGRRVAARHIRAAEAISRNWTPRTVEPPPPPPPPLPGTDNAGTTGSDTTGTPGTTTTPQGLIPGTTTTTTTGFFAKPLNIALLAAGVFLVAKQFKII